MYVSIFLLRNVEGCWYALSSLQQKPESCHSFLTDLDPHPDCSKCVPRGCSRESPCSHCAPLSADAWKKWERQQCSKRSSSSTKGPKEDSAKGGGGTNLGRYAQMFLLPPKPNLPVGWDSRPLNQAFRPSRRKLPPCSRVSQDASGTYSQRYLLESCRSLEKLEIQVTALFSHIKLRERDGYVSRLNPHVPTATRKDWRVSPLVGEYIFYSNTDRSSS